ncbi:unnamed protein product [Didymodactylos carnosus]|uniref:Uncharacterized protein n=1 Tax=Didymodactylos carnosus TaxID=1234261 RepID=A0A815HST2_9BILA|nr:unnamed protein product [Didymodactylos carnosus]CAF4229074.1 unnamed protein product [Didymodactylos carnosus]
MNIIYLVHTTPDSNSWQSNTMTYVLRNNSDVCDDNDQMNFFDDSVLLNKEDITIIWFDKNIDLNNMNHDILKTKQMFEQIHNYILYFTDINTCIDYMQTVIYEKILLILSGTDANGLLSLVHNMLAIFKSYYRGNAQEMKNILTFESMYTSTQAIQCLHVFRYFIADLCLHLCQLHYEQLETSSSTLGLTVYRGVKLYEYEVSMIKYSTGQIIHPNGYLSTTKNRFVAEMYAGVGARC